jgi:hypothetical protein
MPESRIANAEHGTGKGHRRPNINDAHDATTPVATGIASGFAASIFNNWAASKSKQACVHYKGLIMMNAMVVTMTAGRPEIQYRQSLTWYMSAYA